MSKDFNERIYSAVWNQYTYLTQTRERAEKRIDVLLVIAGIMIATFFHLELYENPVNILSIIGFGFVLMVALYGIIPRRVTVPWVSIEEYKNYQNKNDTLGFHSQLVKEVYKHIKDMNDYVDSRLFLLRIMMYTLFLSISIPILDFFRQIHIIFLAIGLVLIFSIICYFNSIFGKEYKKPVMVD